MRYSFISAAILALASSVVAQTPDFDAITAPTKDQTVAAGSSLDIIWEPGTYTGANTVTITLLQGADMASLQLGPVISAGVSNALGKYTWNIPSTEGAFATYGFKIALDTNNSIFQYSFPFHITGSASASSITGSSSGTPTTVTMRVATGTGYTSSTSSSSAVITSTSTSSIPSSTLTIISTSSASTSSIVKPSSNVTVATLTKTTSTKAAPLSTSSVTTSPSAIATTNAAISNMATGGFAMLGGLLIALVL